MRLGERLRRNTPMSVQTASASRPPRPPHHGSLLLMVVRWLGVWRRRRDIEVRGETARSHRLPSIPRARCGGSSTQTLIDVDLSQSAPASSRGDTAARAASDRGRAFQKRAREDGRAHAGSRGGGEEGGPPLHPVGGSSAAVDGRERPPGSREAPIEGGCTRGGGGATVLAAGKSAKPTCAHMRRRAHMCRRVPLGGAIPNCNLLLLLAGPPAGGVRRAGGRSLRQVGAAGELGRRMGWTYAARADGNGAAEVRAGEGTCRS